MIATVKSALTAANLNEKLVVLILMQFLYFDWCRGIHFILLWSVILQRYHYDIIIKTFCFVKAHITASSKGELANQSVAYKIIVLEVFFMWFIWKLTVTSFKKLHHFKVFDSFFYQISLGMFCYRKPNYVNSDNFRYPSTAVLNAMGKNLVKKSIQFQYIARKSGLYINYPSTKLTDCETYDPRFR